MLRRFETSKQSKVKLHLPLPLQAFSEALCGVFMSL